MDLMAFTNAVQDRFFELTSGVAVYASPKDRALGLSEKLYNSSRLGRAVGKIEPWERQLLQLVPQIELVDASVAEKQFGSVLGHSYFFRDPWVSSDIGSFILGRSPAERGLIKSNGDQVFWEFPTDYPEQLKRRFGRNRASNQTINVDCGCEYPISDPQISDPQISDPPNAWLEIPSHAPVEQNVVPSTLPTVTEKGDYYLLSPISEPPQ